MTTSDPWIGIDPNTPAGQLHARRVDASHPHDFFWARDAQGRRLLVCRSVANDECRTLPSLRGIAIELTGDGLVLRLLQHSDLEIFSTLCWSLVEHTRSTRSKEEVLDRIVSHLERWQRFLEKEGRGLLSEQEIRGLFCELIFLESELIFRFGAIAVSFWRGPAGDPQDFSVGTTLFEIKSHAAGAAPILTISSAEQLWHTRGDLFLVSYTIGESVPEAAGAMSLAGLVARIRALLAQVKTLDVFEDRLMALGYVDRTEYATRFFTVTSPDMFAVAEGFPRITADAVPAGVCRVKYGIELAACLPFKKSPDWNSLGVGNGR